MATSPNYGWSEPDNSSLVKNGAADIRTLGDAIDTSVWNVGFGQAGKNKALNGNFGIWQRGTSFTTGSSAYVYTADRWRTYFYGSNTTSVTQQTFTAGAAPVAGYEGQYFLRISSSNTQIYLEQQIEDVRTFAGQTVTFSMWVKQNTAAANTLGTTLVQYFGTGGSASVNTTILSSQSTTTGWVRLTGTATLPSISGKTLGTGHYLAIQISNGSLNNALDIWGVQLEYGSKATPFQTATGTIQGELAACQRYYFRITSGEIYEPYAIGSADTANSTIHYLIHPVTMRVKPTTLDYANLGSYDGVTITGTPSSVSLGTNQANANVSKITFTKTASFTQFRPAYLIANNSASAYIGLSAEL